MEFQYDTSIDNPENLWLPIPRLWDGNGTNDLKIMKIVPAPNDRYYDPNGTGTEIAYWELSGHGTETISIEFEVELSLIKHNIDENQTWPPYDKTSQLYKKNTAPTPWVQSDHPDIVNTAQSIIGTETNLYKQAKLLFYWVNYEIQGSPQNPPEPDGDALLVLQRRTAGCGGYANLFVALCRSIGIPARNIGIWMPYWDEEERRYFEDGLHCYECPNPGFGTHIMSEFYLPGYGWFQCDAAHSLFGDTPQERLFISKGNEIDLLANHSCPSDNEGWNEIDGVHAWLHLPRVPCQSTSGITLKTKLISKSKRPIRKSMPWIPLLLLDD